MSEEETALDAVNAALGGESTPEPETPEPETPEPETPDAGEPSGEPAPEGEPEGEAEPEGEPEAEGEPEKGPNGERERNPDGTWKKVEPKEEAKKEPAKKEKDPINDPIPKDLKKETSERIRTLIDTAKTVTAERDQIKQDFDYLIKGVEATGTSPEQYGETLSWLALFNSRDPTQQEKALELVETVAERLATLLGKERVVGDPLAAHADLADAVKKGQITPQYAKEIARTRNGQQFRTELTTNAQTQEQQRQEAQREEQQGRNALTELENTLRASDPDYERKKAVLVPALKPLMAAIPWAQRKDKFLEAYKNVQLPKPSAPAKVPANQPMRAGKQPAGGQTKAPSSMLEAVSGALSGMKR
jgi:hypothetical protein